METKIIGYFLLFSGLFVFLTWHLTKKRSSGSRPLTYPIIAGSILLTNFSSVQMIGLNGAAFKDGLSVMAWELMAVVGLVLMGIYFLPRYLKSGITTVPEILEVRFDRQTRLLAEGIFLVSHMIIFLPVILYTAAIGLMGILDLQLFFGIQNEAIILWSTVWMLGIIGFVIAFFREQKLLMFYGVLNGIGLLIGGIFITIFGLSLVSGGKGIYEGWLLLQIYSPEKFNPIGNPNQSVPFGTLFSGVLILNLFYWSTNQQIVQKTIGAKKLAEGQKAVLLTGALKLLGPFYLVFPGIIAYYLFAGKVSTPDKAYSMLANKVLPPYLSGLLAAVMVGAALSCYGSVLNNIRKRFYKNIIKPCSLGEQTLISIKIFIFIMGLIPMVIAPFLANQDSIFFYLQKMNGIFFIPLFAVIIMGTLYRHSPPFSAKLALLTGPFIISLGYLVIDSIQEFHLLGLVFVALIGIMFIAGWINPGKKIFFPVDIKLLNLIPWKYASIFSYLLVFSLFWIYCYFSDFSLKRYQLEWGSVLLVIIFLALFRGIKIFYQRAQD